EKKRLIEVSGEVSEWLLDDSPSLRRDLVTLIVDHCSRIDRTCWSTSDFMVRFALRRQDRSLAKNRSDGDSGEAVAVAFADATHYLPWERYVAHELRRLFDGIFRNNGIVPSSVAGDAGVAELPMLLADGKMSVTASYQGPYLRRIDHITVALQHV